MELFKKLKGILFDEVTEEIPVITKEDREVQNPKETAKKMQDEQRRRVQEDRHKDDVIVTKIETPKRERKIELEDDVPFDMPKLKEEAKEEVKRSSFTFPVWDDDRDATPKRRERKEEKRSEPDRTSKRERDTRSRNTKNEEVSRKGDSVGYTNAFDYSYGKYKGDYKSSRERSHEILTKTLEQKEERKAFTPSPIISPVYGVLNENYTKDDIVSKKDDRKPTEVPDLDTVRRKAYGTLEDEIEVSLSQNIAVLEPDEPETSGYEENDDEGISIDDLLVDSSEYAEDDEDGETIDSTLIEEENEDRFEDEEEETLDKIVPVIEEDDDEDEEEIQDVYEKEEVVIEEKDEDFEDTAYEEEEKDEFEIIEEPEEEIIPKKKEKEDSVVKPAEPLEEENIKEEKTENKNEAIGEEDLFDLIESIYERKGEE